MTVLFQRAKDYCQTILCVLAFGMAISSSHAQTPMADDLLFENVRVIVGDGNVIDSASVLISGATIVAVGAIDPAGLPATTARIDLAGKTLMPTLIDAHAHLGYEAFTSWGATNYSAANLIDHLERYAYYGFGAVFSAGSDPDLLALQLQQSQAQGQAGGARFLIAAGMAPPAQGPNNQFLAEALAVERQTGNTILRGLATPEQARLAVQSVAALQIQFIKLWVDDRGGSQTKLQPEIYKAVIAEATQHGIDIVVHQQSAEDMPDLIAAGTRGFLHGRLESGFTTAIAQAAGQNNVFIVPNLGLAELRREAIGADAFLAQTLPSSVAQRMAVTSQRQLVPQRNPELEKTLRASFSELLTAKVDIVLGTDAGAVPDHPFGYTGHRELEIFVRHGMSPLQAISAGTSVAARVLGLENSGRVQEGYRADLLILEANPLDDIRNTRSIYQVYLGGELVDRAALAARFAGDERND